MGLYPTYQIPDFSFRHYLSIFIDLNRKDRAKPPARRGCSAYASESDTTNLQSSIFNSPPAADPGQMLPKDHGGTSLAILSHHDKL
jgi:hypothetical protein